MLHVTPFTHMDGFLQRWLCLLKEMPKEHREHEIWCENTKSNYRINSLALLSTSMSFIELFLCEILVLVPVKKHTFKSIFPLECTGCISIPCTLKPLSFLLLSLRFLFCSFFVLMDESLQFWDGRKTGFWTSLSMCAWLAFVALWRQ